ncbi:DeoR/GlpR family DNA-binding transcription regulator [Tessaracoccus oleiagri]|uniref:Transcriptional regulator, DeoR family n=1 Tax=Tessaracoccus oleiagri TaxID=686624 RepID=A0A1G9HKN5_9ACTN|nr:DeoR/GlpR family DNA-binding transcription regulator [Tessaracoccus oleiagri]SDL13442.1 transcriptional regulator, DeoR family [Tessaracoccus oleiagri]
MLVSDRRSSLLAFLRAHGSAAVETLASELKVSAMTVRRDIDALTEAGLVERVRGGATIVRGQTRPGPMDAAMHRLRAEKEAIARVAATMVEPGMAVGLSGGSTTWFLARQLLRIPDVTVLTNSLAIADLFEEVDDAAETGTSVVLTGGIRTPGRALVGPVAVRSLSYLHCDISFLSVHGIHEEAGLTTPNILEAETSRAMAASGGRTVVVADHTKWDVVSLTTVLDLEDVDVLVTDRGLPDPAAEVARAHIADVRLA